MGFSCAERGCKSVFQYINGSHLPKERRRVASGVVSRKWPRCIICNLSELGGNLIHLNIMRSVIVNVFLIRKMRKNASPTTA